MSSAVEIGPRGGTFVARMKSANSVDVVTIVVRIRRIHVTGVDINTVGRVLIGLQGARDPHLVQVCVGGKRLQAGMLIFPAEAAHSLHILCLENRNINH